jgi:hypothetical protein
MSMGQHRRFEEPYYFLVMLMQSNKNFFVENKIFLHRWWLRDYHVVIQDDELKTVGVECVSMHLMELSWHS